MMPSPQRRKDLRLPDFDYATPGAYFVTICAQDRRFLFDSDPVRAMIQSWWERLPGKFPNLETDEFVIMPNHIHGIIVLTDPIVRGDVGADLCVGPDVAHPTGGHTGPPLPGNAADDVGGDPWVAPFQPVASLPRILQWFKTMTTSEYIRGVKECGWQSFPGKLWQRNYYEHVIRNEREWEAIQYYIRENPARWAFDRENPDYTRAEKGISFEDGLESGIPT